MAKEKGSIQKTIDTIRRKTQRKHSADEKIHIVLKGLRGDFVGVVGISIVITGYLFNLVV